jgi:spore coat protein U-like protein
MSFRIVKRLFLAWALAVAAVVLPGTAAQAAVVCLASASGLGFGFYDPTSSSPTTATGSVTVTCTLVLGTSQGVAYSIALSAGSGTFANRTMQFLGNSLKYNLFTSGGHTTVWGDGGAGTATVSDNYTLGVVPVARPYTVFGKMPPSQSIAAGVYGDTIFVTVTY